jgi:hypothetical protein
MATYTKLPLSGSTNGKNMQVTGNSSGASITVHTAVSGTSDLDEVWLYAMGTSATARKLTIEYGAAGGDIDLVEIEIGAEGTGPVLVIPGWVLQNGLIVKAFAAATNEVNLNGFVNRITA